MEEKCLCPRLQKHTNVENYDTLGCDQGNSNKTKGERQDSHCWMFLNTSLRVEGRGREKRRREGGGEGNEDVEERRSKQSKGVKNEPWKEAFIL